MTSLVLLFWITSGILLQVTIYLGIVFLRHWQGYQALRNSTEELIPPVLQTLSSDTEDIPAVAAWSGLRTFKVERKVVEDGASSVCSFYLKPEDGQPLPHFLPGQFLTFQLDIPNAAGETKQITRCYSLSDSPSYEHYRISIKRAPASSDFPPGHSSNYFHDRVEVGTLLKVRAPAGHFHIDHSNNPVVLIGGGIGITPMLSMLNWALTEQPGREIWLFYGVRNGRELVMKSRLETLAATHQNFHLHFCFSNPLPEEIAGRDFQHSCRIDVALLRTQLPLKPFHFYICGPTPLLESLVPALEDWGVPDALIHFEAFGPSSVKRRPAATTTASAQIVPSTSDIVVTFAQSGKQLQWQPSSANLLDFTESSGIAVNSGCRAGSCGSCQTTILSGEVAYTQPPEYDPEPGACLLCMCKPKTNVTLEV